MSLRVFPPSCLFFPDVTIDCSSQLSLSLSTCCSLLRLSLCVFVGPESVLGSEWGAENVTAVTVATLERNLNVLLSLELYCPLILNQPSPSCNEGGMWSHTLSRQKNHYPSLGNP